MRKYVEVIPEDHKWLKENRGAGTPAKLIHKMIKERKGKEVTTHEKY